MTTELIGDVAWRLSSRVQLTIDGRGVPRVEVVCSVSAAGSKPRRGKDIPPIFSGGLTIVSFDDTIVMVSKHDRTLAAIFSEPTRANVKWADIEALLANKGAVITEGEGSRVRVLLNGIKAVFHRPHPRPETDKGAVRSVRRLLLEAGITP